MMATPPFLDLPNGLDEKMTFRVGQAAGDFVEQQDARTGRERPRQFQPLAIEQRQASGKSVGLRLETGERQNVAAELNGFRLGYPRAEQRRDGQIFEYRQVGKGQRNLERASEAGTAARLRLHPRDVVTLQNDAAPVGPQHAGDQVEQRRFARAVRSDDAERLATRQGEVDVVGDDDRTERFGDCP